VPAQRVQGIGASRHPDRNGPAAGQVGAVVAEADGNRTR